MLTEAREQNKCLRLQVETLRQKLGDAEGDIKALRINNNRVSVEQQDMQLAPSMHQREEMIEQLEKLNLKVKLLFKLLKFKLLYKETSLLIINCLN